MSRCGNQLSTTSILPRILRTSTATTTVPSTSKPAKAARKTTIKQNTTRNYNAVLLLSSLLLLLSFLLLAEDSVASEASGNSVESELQCEPFSLSIPSFIGDEAQEQHEGENDHDREWRHGVGKKMVIIAHRGATFHVPEHTLIGYGIALEMGSDYILSDLVATQDGHLVALHTVDLNETTTDVQKMASVWNKEQWFSPYANRSGYWTYNFTLEQIQQLHVKQRLPNARSTAYDGKFMVPNLIQVQQLIQDWNVRRLPLLTNQSLSTQAQANTETEQTPPILSSETTLSSLMQNPTTAGLYLELKEVERIKQDTGMDLVDMLVRTITQNTELFSDVLTCHPRKYHHYQKPPLVIQSFDPEMLKRFHQTWSQQTTESPSNNTNTVNTTLPITETAAEAVPLLPPPPPVLLLVDRENCLLDEFWFTFGEQYRDIIHGIGPDKKCLLTNPTTTKEESLAFIERIKEYQLVVYPWTERPELEYIDSYLNFNNMFEEIQYLFCNVKVDGIFVEMIGTGVLAANLPCPENDNGNSDVGVDCTGDDNKVEIQDDGKIKQPEDVETQQYGDDTSPNSESSSVPQSSVMCDESEHPSRVRVGFVSFIMGVFLTAIISVWFRFRGTQLLSRPRREQRVPTDDDVEQENSNQPSTNARELEML